MQRANLSDAELLALCEEIEVAQRREIEQMQAIAGRLND